MRTIALLLLSLPLLCSAQEAGIVLTTDQPGNLFAYGGQVEISVQAEGVDAVSWVATDYWGAKVGEGEATLTDGKGAIRIAGLDRGYYEVACKAGEKAGKISLGVVTDHSAQDPPSTRLNVDGATAWLSAVGDLDELARILRMAGIGWVRERFSWGATEREKGKLEYAYQGRDYDRVADTYMKYGVRVYQIWHDSPGWTRPGDDVTRNPQDLRDAYNFAKAIAAHYKDRVQAWEVWNEPDIGFWPDLGDTFAGLQKAAYLGFKAGNPDMPVLLASFCRGYCAFDESLFEAGIADYFDIFNWHIYARPETYSDVLARYLEMLERYDCAGRPVWLSEAGIRVPATGDDGDLNASDERKQAEFIGPSFACSLAAGTDRHFFFVYPWYLERGIQFGALHKNLAPRPGMVAIAAAVDILGDAQYMGEYDFGDTDARGLVFDSGAQKVMVVWAADEETVTIDTGMRGVEISDLLGKRSRKDTVGGKIELKVDVSPQYVIGLGDAALANVEGDVRPQGTPAETSPCPVVIRGQAKESNLNKNVNAYTIGSEPFTYAVEVCNLSETASAKGTVRLELPEGWSADPAQAEISLEPMGRTVPEFTVSSAMARTGGQKLWVRGEFEGMDVAPSVSYFRFDVARVKPAKSLDLGLASAEKWTKNINNIGTLEVSEIEGGVSFVAKFTRDGDRWCYPRATFEQPQDWSAYDGLSLEYRTEGDPELYVRTQVIESGGPSYLGEFGRGSDEWKRAAILFSDLGWGSWSAKDENGKLDLDDVASLMIGLNTNKDDITLQVRNVALFRLSE